jgi:ABC-type arginine/histidine transport system permease subunit
MAAIRTTIIKNTNQETIIKFEGSSVDTAATIDISTIAASTQARNSETPTVNIVKFIALGLLTSAVTITRNSVVVLAAAPENAPAINFTQDGIRDTVGNTSNIVITLGGAASVGYITLRKVAGWATKVEEATYGAYDDRTRVGASTTVSGSPDKA